MATTRMDEDWGQEDWVDLETIFVGRTVHLHSLSPLHPPSPGTTGLTIKHLEAFSNGLASHLTSRINSLAYVPLVSAAPVGTGRQVSRANTEGGTNVIKGVRASFLDSPTLTPQRGAESGPRAFVVEIETVQPNPTGKDPNRKIVETAHLLFFSTDTRQSETHYPLLLWKTSLSGRTAPQDGVRPQQTGDDVGMDAVLSPTLVARTLTAQTLSFLAAYFDCRLSTLAPLHGIRGKNLEAIAETVLGQTRSSPSAMELTFALPSQVEESEGQVVMGPAPELNTISLVVPSHVVHELMDSAGSSTTSVVMPAISHYLSQHTSIQLSRLTLTRVGVANVFLGTPTSTVHSSGKASSGEVRLKVGRVSDGDQDQTDLIIAILQRLIQTANEEVW